MNDGHSKILYLFEEKPNGKFKRNGWVCKAAKHRAAVFKDIRSKWNKFSEQDVSALKGNADLVSQVVAKYGIPQSQAQTEVDALLKGRHLGGGA